MADQIDITEKIEVVLDQLPIFLKYWRAKNIQSNMNVVGVVEFAKHLEKDYELILVDVVKQAGYQGVQEFFKANNIKTDLHGNLVLPSSEEVLQSPYGLFVDATKKEKLNKLKRKNRRKHIKNVKQTTCYPEKEQQEQPEYNNQNPFLAEPDQNNQEKVIQSNTTDIYLYDGNVESLKPGMLVEIANGTRHYIPAFPKILHHNEQTELIFKRSVDNFQRLKREIHRQYIAATHSLIDYENKPNAYGREHGDREYQ